MRMAVFENAIVVDSKGESLKIKRLSIPPNKLELAENEEGGVILMSIGAAGYGYALSCSFDEAQNELNAALVEEVI